MANADPTVLSGLAASNTQWLKSDSAALSEGFSQTELATRTNFELPIVLSSRTTRSIRRSEPLDRCADAGAE